MEKYDLLCQTLSYIGDSIKSNKRKHVILYIGDNMFGRFYPSKKQKKYFNRGKI